MADWGDYANAQLGAADKAVDYLLERIRRDPDLRYLMNGTVALRLLCEAQAQRLGMEATDLLEDTARPFDHRDARREPRLAILNELLDVCRVLADTIERSSHPEQSSSFHSLKELLKRAP